MASSHVAWIMRCCYKEHHVTANRVSDPDGDLNPEQEVMMMQKLPRQAALLLCRGWEDRA